MAERWNPWRALGERRHVEFDLVELPMVAGGGLYWPQEGWAAILVDRSLPRRLRRAALAHELIHDERHGGAGAPGMPSTWRPVVARDPAVGPARRAPLPARVPDEYGPSGGDLGRGPPVRRP